jgi:hypothetical protein
MYTLTPTRLAPFAAGLLAATTLAVGACEITVPKPQCPAAPTNWTIGPESNRVVLNPADYPVAPREPKTSIDIQLSNPYVIRLLKAKLEAPPPAGAKGGVFVDSVSLKQQGSGASALSLVQVGITPWILGTNGEHARLTVSYGLRLKVVPYLVTADKVPDQAKRRALLGNADQGAVLRFELHEFVGRGEVITCSTPDFNLVDSQVLAGIYDSLGHEEPLRLPTASIQSIVDKMVGATTKLKGLNVGTDNGLKIGFLLDRGSPMTFDPYVSFFHLPSNDWGILLDTSFTTAQVMARIKDEVATVDGATADSVSISYDRGGSNGTGSIGVTVNGTVHKCGDVHFKSEVTVSLSVHRRSDGTVLFGPMVQKTTNDANIFCQALGAIFGILTHPFGDSTAVINTGGACVSPMGNPIQFDVGPNDQFYATSIDTDGVFFIAGRSTFMDALFPNDATRPPVPVCPA